LDALLKAKIVSHLLVYTDVKAQKDVGLVTLFLQEHALAYYYYAFYDLNYYQRNLGMFMMTSAVDYFVDQNVEYIYLGTCYSRNAMYKTQFSGAEFFSGLRWSNDLNELKYLIERDRDAVDKHLLETPQYQERFFDGQLENIVAAGTFKIV
jgi:hypothetical protein